MMIVTVVRLIVVLLTAITGADAVPIFSQTPLT
jgi:hypothetical protein